ncbi:MAG: endolytic transglycosylase MltG [Chloroflexota bacterium]
MRRARPLLSEPGYVRPSYRSAGWSRLLFAVFGIGLLLIVLAGAGFYWFLNRPEGGTNGAVALRVSSGDTIDTIAARLQSKGVISSGLLFRVDAKLHGLGGNLKAGDYTLHRNMSIDQMVSALQKYRAITIAVTVPEGLRMEQIATILDHRGISGKQFLREAHRPSFRLPILAGKPARASLEGYLFPDTYYIQPHASGKTVAEIMVQTLGEKFSPSLRAAARRQGLSVYQALILASIVEREAEVPSERAKIASVYLNRLHVGMKLQADPTVQYVLGTSTKWWPMLTVAQYQTPGAYNTYLHKGLPPGPIANPGIASIRAVVHPDQTQYLFFVAKGNGHHAFARTYAEQLANQQKYLKP